MTERILNHRWIKPIVQEAKRLGYKVVLAPNNEDGPADDAYGWTDRKARELVVVLKDHEGKKMSLGEITWVLAHELRHAQHLRNGNFKKYYEDPLSCGFAYGHAAEKNCDNFADNYVESLEGYRTTRFFMRQYPAHKVNGYLYYSLLAKGVPKSKARLSYILDLPFDKIVKVIDRQRK